MPKKLQWRIFFSWLYSQLMVSPVNQPLLPRVNRLQYLTAGRRVWALTHGFRVNNTVVQSDLKTHLCYHVIIIAQYRKSTLVTVLEKSATSIGYKLCPKQTEAVLAFARRHDMSVSLPKSIIRTALKIRILSRHAVAIALTFAILHAGSGKSLCISILPFVYLLSILQHESTSICT